MTSNIASLTKLSVQRLSLTSFRNYASLSCEFTDGPVVITGHNGAGKTNILEALSFLSPGKGLRQVTRLEEIDCQHLASSHHPWVMVADIVGVGGKVRLGTGRDGTIGINSSKRILRIDGKNVNVQSLLPHIFTVMWLTPQMDGLFLRAASERRKFLDRMVYHFYPEHASHVYSYEHSLRERSKLLQHNRDPVWLSLLESKMAERAVAIAAARNDTIAIVQESIQQAPTYFPKALVSAIGLVESLLKDHNALEVEERFKKILHDNRSQDAANKRTQYGIHRSDLQVIHEERQMEAALCSTGEQKALLLAIILAETRSKIKWRETIPVLLLDEVVAHLDEKRRSSLFEELHDMNCQVFMTGTDELLFEPLIHKAQFLTIQDAKLTNPLSVLSV